MDVGARVVGARVVAASCLDVVVAHTDSSDLQSGLSAAAAGDRVPFDRLLFRSASLQL